MSDVTRCGHCRAFVHRGDRFCWSCGADLQRALAPTARQPAWEPDPDVGLLLRRAFLAQRRGEVSEATRLVRQALERDPKSTPALALLAELLRASGDLVGAVEAAHRATAEEHANGAPPGSLAAARRERAEIEETVVREVTGETGARSQNPVAVFVGRRGAWYRSPTVLLALGALGLAAFVIALFAAARAGAPGYLWLGLNFLAAGWCYWDAENRREPGMMWGLLVLCLGLFGLTVYLLTRD